MDLSPDPSFPQTWALRECMLQHKDYYAPLLEEEEEFAAEQEEEADAAKATAPAQIAEADAAKAAGRASG